MIKAPECNLCEDAKRIQAGDTIAFQRIFHILYEPVYKRAVAVLKNYADAADTTQDRIHQSLAKEIEMGCIGRQFHGLVSHPCRAVYH